MYNKQSQLDQLMQLAPVIPVVVLDDPAAAVPMAKVLLASGLSVIEVTLRTPAGLDAIRAIAQEVEGARVGAGTVLTAEQLQAVEKAGACFAVAPGSAPRLLAAAEQSTVPLLPGAATASEAMNLLERGYTHQKFFPAVLAGGAKMLAAWCAVLPQVKFCPTGGITTVNAAEFLALPNVPCIGGTWLTPADRLRAKDWAGIEQLARAAARLPA